MVFLFGVIAFELYITKLDKDNKPANIALFFNRI